VNYIQGNTPDGAPRQPRPKPKPTGRSEIEELLQELSGERRRPKAEQPRPQKPQPERAKAKPKPAPPSRTANLSPKVETRSLPRVASGLPSPNLGESIRTHQLGNQIDVAVQKEIVTAVQQDLGRATATLGGSQERPVHPLVKLLRDPNGVRQAVMLNEILQRPKSTRREHHV
jgi:hypothetical protein